jgi:hypothetical protein
VTPPPSAAPLVARRFAETAAEFLEASVAEEGDSARMSVRRFSQHQYRALLHEAIVLVSGALDAHGVCDRRGRLRTTWLAALERLAREAREIDTLLGVSRTPAAREIADHEATRDTATRDPATMEDFLRSLDRLD